MPFASSPEADNSRDSVFTTAAAGCDLRDFSILTYRSSKNALPSEAYRTVPKLTDFTPSGTTPSNSIFFQSNVPEFWSL